MAPAWTGGHAADVLGVLRPAADPEMDKHAEVMPNSVACASSSGSLFNLVYKYAPEFRGGEFQRPLLSLCILW